MHITGFFQRIIEVEKQAKEIDEKITVIEKTEQKVAILQNSIKNIQKDFEKSNGRLERIEKEFEARKILDKRSEIKDLILRIVPIIISLFAVGISFFNMNTANRQLNTNLLINKTIISCEYNKDTNEIKVIKSRGVSEDIEVAHFPFYSTVYAKQENSGQGDYSISALPIRTNVWGSHAISENENKHGTDIFSADIDSWSTEYADKLENIIGYFQGKMAISMQLGHIIAISFYDPVLQEDKTQYYVLITKYGDNTSVNGFSINGIEKDPGLYEITKDDAEAIFDEQCPMNVENNTTYITDFENYLAYK